MNKRILALLVLLPLAAALAPARDGRRLPPNLVSGLRFGLHMAEDNLVEARLVLRLKEEIGLSAEQQKQIENLMLAYEETCIRRGSDIKVLELKFAALLRGKRIDRRAMEKMAREIGDRRTDLQVGHLNYLLDIRDVLTDEQAGKIESLKRRFAPGPHAERAGGRDRPGLEPPPAPGAGGEEPPPGDGEG